MLARYVPAGNVRLRSKPTMVDTPPVTARIVGRSVYVLARPTNVITVVVGVAITVPVFFKATVKIVRRCWVVEGGSASLAPRICNPADARPNTRR